MRLDPPYWFAIALAVIVAAVTDLGPARPPSFGDLVAHVFYAQQFFGVPHIIGVFWTLCLEIQFYLAYVVLMAGVQRIARDRVWWVFGPFWLLSLVAHSVRGRLHQSHSLFVEIAGLYWHFVDIVWILIFTLVYLIPD